VEHEGKVAVVTGAGQGIGRQIALALAAEGADVAVVDVNPETAAQTAGEVHSKGRRALSLALDVSRWDAVSGAVERVHDELGSVDILVNNAGITRDALIVRMSVEDWRKVLEVNLTGTFNFSKAAAKFMMKRKWGRIVNISSVIGVMGNAGQANYAASKAGVIGLTKSLAKELAGRGITVNAVAPGFIETAMTEKLGEKARAQLMSMIPLARLGTTSDVADVVSFLASDRARYITGQVIHVDGGMVM